MSRRQPAAKALDCYIISTTINNYPAVNKREPGGHFSDRKTNKRLQTTYVESRRDHLSKRSLQTRNRAGASGIKANVGRSSIGQQHQLRDLPKESKAIDATVPVETLQDSIRRDSVLSDSAIHNYRRIHTRDQSNCYVQDSHSWQPCASPIPHFTSRRTTQGGQEQGFSGNRIQGKDTLESVPERCPTAINVRCRSDLALATGDNAAFPNKVDVIARLRPLNVVEAELIDSGVGEVALEVGVNDKKTLLMPKDSMSFRLDGVYGDCTQELFYQEVAQSTIHDVMQGYNGTIFAYGPTGTGKTYTMYGPNTGDETTLGLIHRASKQIFECVRSSDVEAEYELRCGMLEIYKEKLRDLLVETEAQSDLKIKESRTRGVYVSGLTECSVVNEDELAGLVARGTVNRAVAETRLNQFSSRSHTLFVLQITQKFDNGSEKRGVLNLVDLAGSEKLALSGAQDERLEETKKINKSLSALGNVIYALTAKCEHVPYRDSKLTRILQESLGGNFKTTLIVTLSPYSGYKEQTLSTLKFAQRARHVRNNAHINIKQSPEQLCLIIQQLRLELYQTKAELHKLQRLPRPHPSQLPHMHLQPFAESKHDIERPLTRTHDLPPTSLLSESPQDATPSRRKGGHAAERALQAEESTAAAGFTAQNPTSNGQECELVRDLLRKAVQDTADDLGPSSPRKARLTAAKDRWELKAGELRAELEAVKTAAAECQKELDEHKLKVVKLRQELLANQQREKERENKASLEQVVKVVQSLTKAQSTFQVDMLKQQIASLTQALSEAEEQCKQLHAEKQMQFRHLVQESATHQALFKEYKLDAYLTTLFSNDLLGKNNADIDFQEPIEVRVRCGESDLGQTNLYSKEIEGAMTEGRLPSAAQVYLMKQQLLDAAIYNHSLYSVVTALEWKLSMERAKVKIQTSYCEMLEKSNRELTSVLDRIHESHCRLHKRIEKLQGNLAALSLAPAPSMPSPSLTSFPCPCPLPLPSPLPLPGTPRAGGTTLQPRLIRTFNRKSLAKQTPNANANNNGGESKAYNQETRLMGCSTPRACETNSHEWSSISRGQFGLNSNSSLDIGGPSDSEYERRHDHIACLKTELSLQAARAEQLKRSYVNAREHIKALTTSISEQQQAALGALKEETASWQRAIDILKVFMR